jgi:EmrB/QacA subfamily drug resistance transporter
MVIVLMASLDQTIVATALPHIVSDLGGFSDYSWVFTAFLLCQAVTVPIYGKLGDVFGRRPLLLAAIGIFLVGSVCCGAAQNLIELVIFRGVQGIGAGGLIPLVHATVGELIPPRDRGKYQGLTSAMFGTSAIMGPAVGGLIVDNASWRWIFYINLPVGAVALTAIVLTMPKPMERHEHTIDYAGTAVFSAVAGAFLLGLAWGGSEYPWSSVEVIGALTVAAALLPVFVLIERRAAEPLIPFSLLRKGAVATGAISMLLGAICFFGVIAYLPLFVQGVVGRSATASAAALTPFMLGTVTGAIGSGQFVARTGRYRINAMLGPIVLGTGMLLLARMDANAGMGTVARNSVIAGLGLGLMNQTFIVTAQNAVGPRVIGTVTGLLQFSRVLGTALGVTVFGTIIDQGAPRGLLAHGKLIRGLSHHERATFASAFQPAFILGVSLSVVVFLVVFFCMKERPLRGTVDEQLSAEAG